MTARRLSWLKLVLPMSRRDRARLAALDDTQAGMATIADLLRKLSAKHDAYAHAVQQAARASRGSLAEPRAVVSIRNTFLTHAADAVVRSKQTAEALDKAVEALELLAVGLRDG